MTDEVPEALEPAPTPRAAGLLFKRLFSRPVDVALAEAIELPLPHVSVAYYLDSKRKPSVYALSDVQLTCRAGAALTQIPTGVAEEGVRGAPSPVLLENYGEVMNVMARLLTRTEGPLVRLLRTSYHREKVPPELLALRNKARHVVGWQVKIDGYGGGRLTLFQV